MLCSHVHIYRHRDMMAVQGHGVPTFYLSADMCHMLAKSLHDGAFSILKEKEFAKSNFPETHLTSNEVAI